MSLVFDALRRAAPGDVQEPTRAGSVTVATRRYAFPEFIASMNLKSWNKLSADQKKAVQEAAKEVEKDIRAQVKNEEDKALKGLKEKGMQVHVVPENEIAAWQKATESVHALFIKRTGEVGKQMVEFCKNLK